MTNSPPYEWQLTNLLQWQNLNNVSENIFSVPMSDTTPKMVVQLNNNNNGSDEKLESVEPKLTWPHSVDAVDGSIMNIGSRYGQGYGLRGLPGDWSPPPRFVRTYKLLQCVYESNKPKDNESA